MPRFSYKAYDAAGLLQQGEIECESRDAALDALFRRGQHPLEVREGDLHDEPRWWEREILGSRQLSRGALAVFTRELATLINAEIPVDEALRIVSLQPSIPSGLRRTLKVVLRRVTEGRALSEALALEPRTFPEFHWRLIQAAEASGSLGSVLNDLAGFLERAHETRARIGTAMLYPAILLAAAAVTLAVVMTVLLPAIVPLFKDAGSAPPIAIQLLLDTQEFISHNPLVMAVMLGLLAACLVSVLRTERLRHSLDRTLLRIPGISSLISRRETARFARILATLLRNAVPMLDALRISAAVLTSEPYRSAIRDAAEEIKSGGNLSVPLTTSGLFSDLALRLVAVGEQTGQLETMLMRVAEIYDTALARQIDRLLNLMTPILTIVIGVLVGGLILSVMGAIMSVNELALR